MPTIFVNFYKNRLNRIKTMWKTKEEMSKIELLHLSLGHYLTGKIINGKMYYKID